MTKVFIFEDFHNHNYDPLVNHIIKVDINNEIYELEKNGWKINSIQHQIIPDYREQYNTWDKDIFTVVAYKKEYKGEQ